MFQEQPTSEKLNSLVGFAWYYLIEGPIDSGKYDKDENNIALDLLKKAKNSTNDNLKEVVNVILEHSKQRKYKPLKVKHKTLEQIFHGDSLLEEYFKELYS